MHRFNMTEIRKSVCKMTLTILSLLSLIALTEQTGFIWPFIDHKIINGEDVKLGEIPYQISLQTSNSDYHFCGGSILNKNYVITGAHCVVGINPETIKVVAGTVDLKKPGSTHRVENIIIHEFYNPRNSWNNDIALVKVKDLFIESKVISYVPLPLKDHVHDNDTAVVSGWGRSWRTGSSTNILQRANIYIVNQEYCKAVYSDMEYEVYPSQICAYDSGTEKGSYNGDSGGPLTVDGKLVGLVSWTNDFTKVNYPTVYTRVGKFLDWIQANAI